MARYFIEMAYDGTSYFGWQRQPNARSVESTITEALKKLLQENIEIVGCGRTDTGVSALDYYAHFETEKTIDCQNFVHRLNIMLPHDIVIKRIFPCGLHARFDAISRQYKYYISKKKDPFNQHIWIISQDIDFNSLNDGCKILLKYSDFTSFAKLHSNSKTNICTIFDARFEDSGDILIFTITANRFLRGMVRAIVGTLIDLGKGKITLDDFTEIIEKKNRSFASMQAPACALFLSEIKYNGI